jgi:hypothetical protein
MRRRRLGWFWYILPGEVVRRVGRELRLSVPMSIHRIRHASSLR